MEGIGCLRQINTCCQVPLLVNLKKNPTFKVWCFYRYLVHGLLQIYDIYSCMAYLGSMASASSLLKYSDRINNDDILCKTLIDDTLTHRDDGIKQRGKYLP